MLFQRFTMPWKGMTGSIADKATRHAQMVPPGWTQPFLIVIGIRFNATKLAESPTFTLVSVDRDLAKCRSASVVECLANVVIVSFYLQSNGGWQWSFR
jgi:hypothetical protein